MSRPQRVFAHQPQRGADAAVRGASGGVGLVAHARDLEDAADVAGDFVPARLAGVVEREIAERPLQDVARAGKTGARQLEGRDRGARVQTDLQADGGRAFDVRLHGAGQMAVGQAEGVARGGLVQAGELAQGGGGAQPAAHGWPEEAHRRALCQRHVDGEVQPCGHGGDQAPAVHAALALGIAQRGGRDAGEGVHHGAVMDRVEFLVEDLVGVEHDRAGQRQPFAAGPDRGLGALAQRGGGLLERRHARVARA